MNKQESSFNPRILTEREQWALFVLGLGIMLFAACGAAAFIAYGLVA